jgi:hypothetical protein
MSRRRRLCSVASAVLVGKWKRVTPASLHAIAQKPAAVSNTQ